MPQIPERAQGVELLDRMPPDERAVRANLADIQAANRWLGGTASLIRAVQPLLRLAAAERRPVRVLDVGCGGGDGARALARLAGPAASVLACDLRRDVLRVAYQQTGGQVALCAAQALRLPFGDASVDIVVCSQLLHHFDPPAAVELLRELQRVARTGMVVCDLARSWAGIMGAYGLRAVQRSPLSRHDGPLSARRAYTPAEAAGLARAAGLASARVVRDGWLRLAIIQVRDRTARMYVPRVT